MKARAKAKKDQKNKVKPLPEIPPRLPPMPNFLFAKPPVEQKQPVANDPGTATDQKASPNTESSPSPTAAKPKLRADKKCQRDNKKGTGIDLLKPPVKPEVAAAAAAARENLD